MFSLPGEEGRRELGRGRKWRRPIIRGVGKTRTRALRNWDAGASQAYRLGCLDGKGLDICPRVEKQHYKGKKRRNSREKLVDYLRKTQNNVISGQKG